MVHNVQTLQNVASGMGSGMNPWEWGQVQAMFYPKLSGPILDRLEARCHARYRPHDYISATRTADLLEAYLNVDAPESDNYRRLVTTDVVHTVRTWASPDARIFYPNYFVTDKEVKRPIVFLQLYTNNYGWLCIVSGHGHSKKLFQESRERYYNRDTRTFLAIVGHPMPGADPARKPHERLDSLKVLALRAIVLHWRTLSDAAHDRFNEILADRAPPPAAPAPREKRPLEPRSQPPRASKRKRLE